MPYPYNYSRYRVKSPVKTFRDLEVYQKTIQLSEELSKSLSSCKKESEKDRENLKAITEKVPNLVAEAYGDRFDSKELAHKKLTEAITLISNIITKIDLLREKYSQNSGIKEPLDKLLTKYQTQKRKILNLRKAWDRVFKNRENETRAVD